MGAGFYAAAPPAPYGPWRKQAAAWPGRSGPIDSFKEIGDALKSIGIHPEEAELRFLPNNPTELEVGDTLQVMRMVDQLEELDDVQAVYSTLSISDAALEQLEAA